MNGEALQVLPRRNGATAYLKSYRPDRALVGAGPVQPH